MSDIYVFDGNIPKLNGIVEEIINLDGETPYINLLVEDEPVHIRTITDTFHFEGMQLRNQTQFLIFDDEPFKIREMIPVMVMGREYTAFGYDINDELFYVVAEARWTDTLGE